MIVSSEKNSPSPERSSNFIFLEEEGGKVVEVKHYKRATPRIEHRISLGRQITCREHGLNTDQRLMKMEKCLAFPNSKFINASWNYPSKKIKKKEDSDFSTSNISSSSSKYPRRFSQSFLKLTQFAITLKISSNLKIFWFESRYCS